MEDVGIFYDIWSILRPFCIFYDHLVYFAAIGYILFSRFGVLYHKESGNPALQRSAIFCPQCGKIQCLLPILFYQFFSQIIGSSF
jgi:hypothetical protein